VSWEAIETFERVKGIGAEDEVEQDSAAIVPAKQEMITRSAARCRQGGAMLDVR
jgi:hypothetical protein